MSFIQTIFGSGKESSSAEKSVHSVQPVQEDYIFPDDTPTTLEQTVLEVHPSQVFIVIHNGKPIRGFHIEEKAAKFLNDLTEEYMNESKREEDGRYKLVNGKAVFIYTFGNNLLHRMTYTGIPLEV